jgi:protein O-GlcNAc transferase
VTSPDPLTLLRQGLACQRSGDSAGALAAFRAVLTRMPGQPDALHLLGATLLQQGDAKQALPWIEQAVAARPTPVYLNTLGVVRLQLGDRQGARTALTRAMAADGGSGEAAFNLARLEAEVGDVTQSAHLYQTLMAQGHTVRAGLGLGALQVREGQNAAARATYLAVLAADPNQAEAHHNLGCLDRDEGDGQAALQRFLTATQLRPTLVEAWDNLGVALLSTGQAEQALAAFDRALALAPSSAKRHYNRANALQALLRFDDSIAAYRQALALQPDYALALNNLANALRASHRVAEAMPVFAAAHHADAYHLDAFSNWLMTQLYLDEASPQALAQAHAAYSHAVEVVHGPAAPRWSRAPAGQRLRVGLVSADFRRHSVAFFVEPLLRHWPHDVAEVICFAQQAEPADATTAKLRALADGWHKIQALDDAAAAACIAAQGIDILVDLAGHSAHTRLPLFARRPAPRQVSWLGYPHITGLPQIDARLVDALTDPDDLPVDPVRDGERLLRLPAPFLCYAPPESAPSVRMRAAEGPVVFASFNTLPKLSAPTIALWARVLAAVPGAVLRLKDRAFGDQATCARVRADFSHHGIDAARITLLPATRSLNDHLEAYGSADIALDPTPYAGTTTTCEALWMGVPVVTLAGKAHASRVGVSLLQAVGLPELIAADADAYVTCAVNLAADVGRRQALRAGMRARLRASALLDGAGFAQRFVAALQGV